MSIGIKQWGTLVLLFFVVAGASFSQTKNPLSDPAATAETKALYEKLRSLEKKAALFGHQDSTLYGVGWSAAPGQIESDIHLVTGEFPALQGWDLGNLERVSENVGNLRRVPLINGPTVDTLVGGIKEGWKRGVVASISWHMGNLVTGGDFKDTSDTQAVKRVLPGGDKHAKLVSALNLAASVFELLKDDQGKPIPVLFRPWHEHSGDWFWWGLKCASIEEFKQLFTFTVQYLREKKNIHNLITTYSGDVAFTSDALLERYPGNSVVDLIGVDDYANAGYDGSVDSFKDSIDVLAEAGQTTGKPIALTETGLEALPMENWFTTRLLPVLKYGIEKGVWYVMLWRNAHEAHFYAPYPGQASANDFKTFSKDKSILFANAWKNWK